MNKYFRMITQSPDAYDKVRGYTLRSGDEFEMGLTRANLNELLRASTELNELSSFYIVKIFRAAIWYDPRTWFKQFMRVRYEAYQYATEENFPGMFETVPAAGEKTRLVPVKEKTEDE